MKTYNYLFENGNLMQAPCKVSKKDLKYYEKTCGKMVRMWID